MAANRGKVFSAESAKRIANVVRRVEGTPIDLTGRRRRWPVTSPDAGMFPVLIKRVGGSDGNATTFASWTYDLYELDDTGYTNKLNTTALQPQRSAARIVEGKVTRPSDGTVGIAYVDADGNIKLWDLQETRSKFACT